MRETGCIALQGIYELVNQGDFEGCSPELVSMQAQSSQNDGIAVSVVGFVRLKVCLGPLHHPLILPIRRACTWWLLPQLPCRGNPSGT